MSAEDLVQAGKTFANHAIENDNAACSTNDPNYYSQAASSYQRAIELYTQALATERDSDRRNRLSQYVSEYRQRHTLMNDWLKTYAHQQQRQREATQRRSSIPPEHISRLPIDYDHDIFDSPSSRPSPTCSPMRASAKPPIDPDSYSGSPYHPQNKYRPKDKNKIPTTSTPSSSSNSTSPGISGPYTPSAPPMSGSSELYSAQSAVPPYYNTSSPGKRPVNHISPKASRPPRQPEAQFPLEPQRPDKQPMKGTDQSSHQAHLSQTHDLLSEHVPSKSFDEIVGLEKAKEILKEAVLYCELEGLLGAEHRKWASVLLFGPSGTGKRILAEAAAKEGGLRYFRVWGGHLKKEMDVLVEKIGEMGRVLIHVEDVEQMEGRFRGFELCDNVLWVFTTREPWKLNEAFLRRVERRIHVGMPGREERALLLELLLRDVAHDITLEEIECIAKECENFSGADLGMLVRDAAMEPVRTVRDARWFRRVTVKAGVKEKDLYAPCSRADEGAREGRLDKIGANNIQVPAVGCLDFDLAMESTKPSVKLETILRHIECKREMGMDGS